MKFWTLLTVVMATASVPTPSATAARPPRTRAAGEDRERRWNRQVQSRERRPRRIQIFCRVVITLSFLPQPPHIPPPPHTRPHTPPTSLRLDTSMHLPPHPPSTPPPSTHHLLLPSFTLHFHPQSSLPLPATTHTPSLSHTHHPPTAHLYPLSTRSHFHGLSQHDRLPPVAIRCHARWETSRTNNAQRSMQSTRP